MTIRINFDPMAYGCPGCGVRESFACRSVSISVWTRLIDWVRRDPRRGNRGHVFKNPFCTERLILADAVLIRELRPEESGLTAEDFETVPVRRRASDPLPIRPSQYLDSEEEDTDGYDSW